MKNCCGAASGLLKVTVVILFITVVLHVIGFATPFWSQRVNSNEGLWEICQAGECFNSADSPVLATEDWYVAVQALMILSFIFAVVTVVLLLLVVCCAKFASNKPLIISAMAIALFTAVFILISIVIYGVRGKVFFEQVFAEAFVVGFSYILSAIAVFGFLFVALFLAIDLNRKFNEDEEEEEAESADAAEKGEGEPEATADAESTPDQPTETTASTDDLVTETESSAPSAP